MDEPELAAEHLIAIDEAEWENFIAARIDRPFCPYPEETVLQYDSKALGLPETERPDRLRQNRAWSG